MLGALQHAASTFGSEHSVQLLRGARLPMQQLTLCMVDTYIGLEAMFLTSSIVYMASCFIQELWLSNHTLDHAAPVNCRRLLQWAEFVGKSCGWHTYFGYGWSNIQ